MARSRGGGVRGSRGSEGGQHMAERTSPRRVQVRREEGRVSEGEREGGGGERRGL